MKKKIAGKGDTLAAALLLAMRKEYASRSDEAAAFLAILNQAPTEEEKDRLFETLLTRYRLVERTGRARPQNTLKERWKELWGRLTNECHSVIFSLWAQQAEPALAARRIRKWLQSRELDQRMAGLAIFLHELCPYRPLPPSIIRALQERKRIVLQEIVPSSLMVEYMWLHQLLDGPLADGHRGALHQALLTLITEQPTMERKVQVLALVISELHKRMVWRGTRILLDD